MAQSTINQSTGISYTKHIYIHIYIIIFIYLYINKYTPFQKHCNLKIHIKYMYTHNGRIVYCQHLINISQCGRASLPSSVALLFTIFFLFRNSSFILNSFQFPLFSLCSQKGILVGRMSSITLFVST